MLNKNTNNKIYATIIEGSIRVRTNEGVEGAIKRDYENKDGSKMFKWELHYDNITGVIENITFKDTEYGKNLEITIDGTVLSVGVKGNYGQDLMKKLPELNLNEEVKLVPYDFVDDNGKARKGITVYRNEKKIPSYFHIMDGKKFKSIHGFPIPDNGGEGFTKNQWIAFYLKVEDFLIDYTEKNVITKINKEIAGTDDALNNAQEIMGGDEITTDEVPF